MQGIHANSKGVLYNYDEQIPIVAKSSSKYSFLIACSDGNTIIHGIEVQNPSLKVNKKDAVHLGRCRMLIEPNIDGNTGHLIFTEFTYDLENLFDMNKIVKLQSGFMNLPCVISHNKILPTLKNYIADMTYALGVYKGHYEGAVCAKKRE